MGDRSRFSLEPLYVQVREHLAQRISAGDWPPGAAIPNEVDLARSLGVSPGTVRKALDLLEAEKLVVRRQGRGTFVLDQTSKDLAVRFSNIRDRQGRRLIGDLELVSQTRGTASEVERRRLGLGADEQVARLARVRRHAGKAFLYEDVSLPLSRFPGVGEGVPNQPIAALAQRHGVRLARSREEITVAEAPTETAARLNVEVGAPLLRLDRTVYSADGQPVEWRVGLCHLGDDKTYLGDVG